MRLAAARSRRIAGDLLRPRRHGRGLSQRAMVSGLVICLALLWGTALTLIVVPADAGASSLLAGRPVPPGQLRAIETAALSCPALSPPRLAAQVMAASKFDPRAMTAGGGSGVAGLTAAQWRLWAPTPGAARGDVNASIVALAHDVCDLAGRVRAARVPGDQWRLALAAFHSGLHAVIAARGVPASAAGYVAAVAAYTNWYARQPVFGGAGVPAPAPASHSVSTPAPASPQPTATPAPASASARAAASGTALAAGPAGGWQLAWSDEFSGAAGSAPDASKWSHDTGGSGWGNQELEYYTDSTANAALDGRGHLVITALKGSAPGSCWYGACRYTSARLLTAGRFSQAYGRISARIKIPAGQGIWPSFWALGDNIGSVGWPQSGQMDIMTSLTNPPATVSAGLIGPSYNKWSSDTLSSGTFADGYHTFTADWYPDHISFFVDGHLYDTQYRAQAGASWVFDHPFFLILNLAVGGKEPGNPSASTTFPQRMLVDWVRVYKSTLP